MQLLDYWREALNQTIGIAIQVDPNDRKLLQQQLYRARGESQSQAFDGLVIVMPQESGELLIVHKDADNADR